MTSQFRLYSEKLTKSDTSNIVDTIMALPDENISLYNYIVDKISESSKLYPNVTLLYQTDFDNGTYRICKPGIYRLAEDIVFNPNPSTWDGTKLVGDDWFPTESQITGGAAAKYPVMPYGPYHLGFFAAITVEADNIILDLNNYSISQSIEHYLQQRFFSLIELASSPFIPTQGPSNFGPKIVIPTTVKIMNGKLGLSSHQAIHGNGMSYVIIENLTIYDYEQAGIALNGGENIIIRDVNIMKNSRNVFINAKYSASRFVKTFLQKIITAGNPSITIKGESYTGTDILNNLITSMDSVYKDIVINKILPTSEVFRNQTLVADGNIYGIVLNVLGMAVHDFITTLTNTKGNTNILVNNVTITNLECSPVEVVGLSATGNTSTYGKVAQKGPVGDVFRVLESMDENEYYVPDVLANAQCYIAKYASLITSGGTTNIESYIYENWISSPDGVALNTLLPADSYYVCNGDSMAHSMKGTIGIFLQGLQSSTIMNVTLEGISNIGGLGEVNKCPTGTPMYQGNITRGCAVVMNKNVLFKNVNLKGIYSKSSKAIGVDFINGGSNITMQNFKCLNIMHAQYLDSGAAPNFKPSSSFLEGANNVTNLVIK